MEYVFQAIDLPRSVGVIVNPLELGMSWLAGEVGLIELDWVHPGEGKRGWRAPN
jgi:hypothetical protein